MAHMMEFLVLLRMSRDKNVIIKHEITIALGIGSIFRDSLKLKVFKTDVISVNSVSEKRRTQKDFCYTTKEL